MRFWKTLLKRSVLALVAAAVALTWTRTGRAQAPCLIERGQDPLDVLNSGVRHNVWIVLDASGSMSGKFAGPDSKLTVAKRVLNQLMDELVDASGKPIVNWAFSYYDKQVKSGSSCGRPDNDGDGYSDEPSSCHGLKDGNFISPSTCGQDNRAEIRATLNAVPVNGGTPIGVAFTDIASYIRGQHTDNSIDFVTNLLPNQKNFLIHVTDGQDTCECTSYGYDIPALDVDGDGQKEVPVRGSSQSSNITGYSESSSDRASYNAGLKGYVALKKIDPTLDGSKGNVFVIGMDLDSGDKAKINSIAWMASGAHLGRDPSLTNPGFFADDPQGLVDAFRNILARIGVPASRVTLGAPTVGTVREVVPQYTNPSVAPDELIGDVGPSSVDPDDIREARTNRVNHQSNVVFSTSVEIPNFLGHFAAHNIYRVTDPANPRTSRQADFTKIWDAGEILQLRSPDSRNILFNKKGQTTLLPFNSATVSAADLGVTAGYLSNIDNIGAKTANDARDMVIGVVRGYRLSKDPTTGTLYRSDGTINFSTTDANGFPTWKLYDAIASPAVVGSPPRSPDFDPPQAHADKYGVGGTQVGDGFYWDHFNRRTMVYLPTNGGMLHAFDGETGDEVFAYIPDDVIGLQTNEVAGSRDTLAEFVELVVAENNGIQNHQFTMSGAPSVRDAFLRSDAGGDNEWHTVLAFGRGRGGRFMSVLDITDPQAPELRFNIGNREGVNDGLLDGLGETWSTPVMGNVQTSSSTSSPDQVDQWLAFFGAGYGCNNTLMEGHYLFAVRVEDGSVYHRAQVTNDNTAVIPYNAVVAMPTLYNPHQQDVADNKDYITRVYVGDIQGVIWKLVTTALSPSGWTFQKFAELGNNQPITAPVALMDDPNGQQVYVMAGTGGDLRAPSTNTLFKFVTLIDNDLDGANTSQYPLGSTPFWSKDLNPEERVYVAPVTIGTIENTATLLATPLVFFAASAPGFNTSTCTGFFNSSLFALGILSGLAEVDLDGGGKDESVAISGTKITGLYARDGNLYVSKSGGLGSGSGGVTVYGDGDFSDDVNTSNSGMTIQVLVDGFRISPF